MKNKKPLVTMLGWGIIICIVVSIVFRAIQFLFALVDLAQVGIYPEWAPDRELVSSNEYSYLWSKKTGDGSQHLVFTQIFVPDINSIVYITPYTMNSVEFSTGKLLWSREIPEDSTFYFYDNKLFTLDSYDKKIPFVPETNVAIPSRCNSWDQSTLRVYNPHTGEIEWEYSYNMVAPGDIVFKDDSALIEGLTIGAFAKYISIFKIDIRSGKILGVDCQNLNAHSHPPNPGGVLTSGSYPITRDWQWNEKTDSPAFVTDGLRLIMVDRLTKKHLKQIEFSRYTLNPEAVQLFFRDEFLVVYLDDSNQFFAFQTK